MFCICVVLSQVTRRFTVMFTTLDHRKRERQKKRESRRQASEAKREKERQRAGARDKKQRRLFMEEQHEQFKQFVAAVRKWEIRAAMKVKMRGSEKRKVNKNTYDISSIKRVTRKFLEVSRCGRARQWQKKCSKKVYCTCKVAFLLIRPIVFSPFSLPSPLSITRFYILFAEYTINIIESFAFSPG